MQVIASEVVPDRAGWPTCAWPTFSGLWEDGLVCTTSILAGVGSDPEVLAYFHIFVRDRQALVWWFLPGGYFGLGWIRDMWRIPEYVKESNRESGWWTLEEEKMRRTERPPWKMARWGGMLVVGNMLGMLPSMAVPNKDEIGYDLSLIGTLLTPLGCALGIWLVGNIGREVFRKCINFDENLFSTGGKEVSRGPFWVVTSPFQHTCMAGVLFPGPLSLVN